MAKSEKIKPRRQEIQICCLCCASVLPLVHIFFSFVSNSLSDITIPLNKGK